MNQRWVRMAVVLIVMLGMGMTAYASDAIVNTTDLLNGSTLVPFTTATILTAHMLSQCAQSASGVREVRVEVVHPSAKAQHILEDVAALKS